MFSIIKVYEHNPYVRIDDDADAPTPCTLCLVVVAALFTALFLEPCTITIPLLRMITPLYPKYVGHAQNLPPPPLPVCPALSPFIKAGQQEFPRNVRRKNPGFCAVLLIVLLCCLSSLLSAPLRDALKIPQPVSLVSNTTNLQQPAAADKKP